MELNREAVTMHTFKGEKTRIHYNLDMSGTCNIIDMETECEVTVPCEDIVAFVAEYVRSQRVGEIEQMGIKEVLGLQ